MSSSKVTASSSAGGGKIVKSNKGGSGGDKNRKGGGGGDKVEYTDFVKSAIPCTKDVPRMVVGAIELCTFFPHHTQWPRYLLRLLRNGWRTPTIVKAQLHARGAWNRDNYTRRNDAMRQQIRTGGRAYYGDQSWTQSVWLSTTAGDAAPFPATADAPDMYDLSRDASVWGPSRLSSWGRNNGAIPSTDLPTLQQIVNGVVNWPTGNDRGLLTRALEWAVSQGVAYLANNDISQLPVIIANHPGWTLPNEATNTATWDQEALRRLDANVAKLP